ncbi:universal stress protein [Streptomyces sp. NPDC023998]|uniref:universal stress protein n=1 Tax=Streptomyces sp. NPDC023998 TaxID=3154597 RepID=UPI0033F733A8
MEVLLSAARTALVLVLGSPAPSPSETPDTLDTPTGFFSASVTTGVIAYAERPVVLVRTREQAEDEWLPVPSSGPRLYEEYRDVVLGLDLTRPCDTLIEYTFAAAASRGAALRIVHGWSQPPVFGPGSVAAVDPGHGVPPAHAAPRLLDEVLRPWHRDFPAIEVKRQCVVGHAQDHLVDASKDASLLVVGRRIRRSAIGPQIGPVTRAVLRRATAPWRSSRTTDFPHRVLQLSAPRRHSPPVGPREGRVSARKHHHGASGPSCVPHSAATRILFRTPRLCAAGADGIHIRRRTAPMPPRPEGGTPVGRVRGESGNGHASLGHGEDDGARRAGRDKHPRPLPSPQLVRLPAVWRALVRHRAVPLTSPAAKHRNCYPTSIDITRARDSPTARCRAGLASARRQRKALPGVTPRGRFQFGPFPVRLQPITGRYPVSGHATAIPGVRSSTTSTTPWTAPAAVGVLGPLVDTSRYPCPASIPTPQFRPSNRPPVAARADHVRTHPRRSAECQPPQTAPEPNARAADSIR